MSSLERYQGNLDAAAAEAKRARDIFDPLNHPDQASAEWQLALVRLEQRRDVEALQVLIRAERHFAERRNREEALYWLVRVGLGLAQLRTGDDRGRALMEEALAAVKERAQPPSSTLADAYALAASAAEQRKDLLSQRDLLQRQHAQELAVFGAGHLRTLKVSAQISRLAE
jgi:hypothetical protein